MYRPDSLAPAPIKQRLHYAKTFTRLAQLFKDPTSIRPDDAPAELAAAMEATRISKVPQLKGNVYQTLKEIVTLFIAEWRKAPRAINVAIRTTNTSLTKRCGNKDPKTAYFHILCLIEHGFLRAKVQVKGGLQLLLNPALMVYESGKLMTATVTAPTSAVAPAAVSSAMGGLQSLLDIGNFLSQKMNLNGSRRT